MRGPLSVANVWQNAQEPGEEDVWNVIALEGFWHSKPAHTMGNDGTATESTTVTVQIPEAQTACYVEPGEYDGDGWTLRPGDLILRGALDYRGDYGGFLEMSEGMEAMTVDSVADHRRKGSMSVPDSGPLAFLGCIYVEGA